MKAGFYVALLVALVAALNIAFYATLLWCAASGVTSLVKSTNSECGVTYNIETTFNLAGNLLCKE